MKTLLHGLAAFLALAITCCLFFVAGYHKSSRIWQARWDALPSDHHSDTVYVPDTSHYEAPEPKIRYVYDTTYVKVPVKVHDTLYVPLPIERRVYEEEDYRAVVSGYKPNLESIDIFKNTVYVTNTVTKTIPPPRWSFGVTIGPQFGYGLTKDGRGAYMGFGGTFGLQYRF